MTDKTDIPDGWFPIRTCPDLIFLRFRFINPKGIFEHITGYEEDNEIRIESHGTMRDEPIDMFDIWQPVKGLTSAFGPWIDVPPTIDTGLMYRVVLLDEKEYYGRYDVLLNEWDLKENNLWGQLSVDADRIIKLCRAIGAVEGVG